MVSIRLKPRWDALGLGQHGTKGTHGTPGQMLHTEGVLLEIRA